MGRWRRSVKLRLVGALVSDHAIRREEQTPDQGAHHRVERIRTALDERNRVRDHPYDLSASLGFAHFDKLGTTDSIVEMLRRADAMMYAAKQQTVRT